MWLNQVYRKCYTYQSICTTDGTNLSDWHWCQKGRKLAPPGEDNTYLCEEGFAPMCALGVGPLKLSLMILFFLQTYGTTEKCCNCTVVVLSQTVLCIIYGIKLNQHGLNKSFRRKLSQCITWAFLWCLFMEGGPSLIAAPVLVGNHEVKYGPYEIPRQGRVAVHRTVTP